MTSEKAANRVAEPGLGEILLTATRVTPAAAASEGATKRESGNDPNRGYNPDLPRNAPDGRNSSTSRRRLTLGEYIRRRNGVPAGAPGSLRNMLQRSLGAGSFAGFWRYWNPVFGYYLGKYSYAPLQRVLPRPLALVLTFVLCGFVHDLVTMAFRGSVTLFFTPWFLFLGLGVVLGNNARTDLSRKRWAVRASVNIAYVLGCLLLTIAVRAASSLP